MPHHVHCHCGGIEITLNNKPIVHAYCHCVDCRDLLGLPFHSVTAWKEENVSIDKGAGLISAFKHPTLNMEKHFCSICGDVLFNTNGMNWSVVSQLLIAQSNGGKLPDELASDKHFFYEQRVTTVEDSLPKFLRGTDGPLYESE